MEMLSEHTVEGWLEGYLLTGRHGLINSYEPFIHVIDSMFNQHAKWLEKCNELPWRAKVSSLNLLITALVWRQDHNGFTHQDPGFLDVVANKSPSVVRIYLPPDANCLLSVADHCLRSVNYVNVIVADKQLHLQYLDMEAAIEHCTKGAGIWSWASNDQGVEPDVVMASCGDVPTMESLAATALLRQHLPDVKVRFVNVVDLVQAGPEHRTPAWADRSGIRGPLYPGQASHLQLPFLPVADPSAHLPPADQHNIHVRGYKEQGNINTPLELAIRNQTDRFSLAIDAIDRMPRFRVTGVEPCGRPCLTSKSRVKTTLGISAWTIPKSRTGSGRFDIAADGLIYDGVSEGTKVMSKMLPVIYLARHGETAWSLSGQHTGLTDIPLTEQGQRNASRLGDPLKGLTFAKVFTSPLQRAVRTCELAGFGSKAEVDRDLLEWNYGQYEGKRTRRDPCGAPGLAFVS